MEHEELEIEIGHAGLEWVRAALDRPPASEPGPVVLLAHGAGAPFDSEFMTAIATGLAAAGFPTLRFNYGYAERMQRENRRLPPDRRPILLAVHRAAAARLEALYPGRPLVFAGKSMGGRMASYLAAEGDTVHALVFYGYPLHPPGRRSEPRSEHFAAVAQRALFLQGSRDALCELEDLRTALATYGGSATLEVIEGADHDFALPRSAGRTRADVLAELVARTAAWIGR